MAYYLYKTCDTCGGDGTVTITGEGGGNFPCWHCTGAGKIKISELPDLDTTLADIQDRCNDIMDKCNDIFEKVSE